MGLRQSAYGYLKRKNPVSLEFHHYSKNHDSKKITKCRMPATMHPIR